MKRLTLKELTISLPTIEVLEARTLFGGSGGYSCPDVVIWGERGGHDEDDNFEVEPERMPQWEHENDQDYNEIEVDYRENDDDPENRENQKYVPVQNGQCVSGSIDYVKIQRGENVSQGDTHSVLENKFGYEENKGYNMNSKDFKSSVQDNFEKTDAYPTERNIQTHLENENSYVICRNEDRTHAIVLNEYDEENERYRYIDPITAEEGYIDIDNIRDPVIIY